MTPNARQLNMLSRERHLQELVQAKPQTTLRIAPHWTPEQALAVYETLDDLIDLIWRQYGLDIQHAFKNQYSDNSDNFNLSNNNQDDSPF